MLDSKYIGAYKEVDDSSQQGIEHALKGRIMSEFFDATVVEQYPVSASDYAGGVAVVEIDADEVPDDLDAFKEKIGADEVVVKSSTRKAANALR